MARIRITLEDEAGREIEGMGPRFYELKGGLGNLHEIEGALEEFKRQVLPELTRELLTQAQQAAIADPKKEVR